MGLTLVASALSWDDLSRNKRATRSEGRAARDAQQPVATNASTEEDLAEFIDHHRLAGTGLPELARWDPAGRPESYPPDAVAQVADELLDALARPGLPSRHVVALQEALALARRCQTEKLHLLVLPD